jgi:hypothetical protein
VHIVCNSPCFWAVDVNLGELVRLFVSVWVGRVAIMQQMWQPWVV